MYNIDEIMEMLDCNNDIKVQEKGIELAKNIKTINVFIKPLHLKNYKNSWNNCAKILSKRTDEELRPFVSDLLEWLKEEQWNHNLIIERLKLLADLEWIESRIKRQMKIANGSNNNKWLTELTQLLNYKKMQKEITEELSQSNTIVKNDNYNIGDIMGMLDCKNDIKVQEKGIEYSKNVKSLEFFIRPKNVNVWENCAKILSERTDEELTDYLTELLEWLKNIEWPGATIIMERLKNFSEVTYSFKNDFIDCVNEAKSANDNTWICNLSELLDNNKIKNKLSIPLLEILGKQRNMNSIEKLCEYNIDELIELLNSNNDEEIQEKGIELAKKIKSINIFLQPFIPTRQSKIYWENCAIVLAERTDEELSPYLVKLIEWIQDINWPGALIIMERLKQFSNIELLALAIEECVNIAIATDDEIWISSILELLENKDLYNSLSKKVKNIIKKHNNKRIYDDIVNDVKEEYIDLLKQDVSNEEATQILIKKWKTKDIYEEAKFWIALADSQWEYGRLQEEVKKQALYYLESDIVSNKERGEEKSINIKKVLEKIRKKINSPMPKEKKIIKYKKYICPWNIGDIYAYQIKENEEYKGKYIVIIKISEKQSWKHNICPIVYVYNKMFEQIPNIEELKDVPYLIQFPDYKRRYEDMKHKCLLDIENSTEKMTKDYIYIGNTSKYLPPNNEEGTGKLAYYCSIQCFEKTQIEYYNKWKWIKYFN